MADSGEYRPGAPAPISGTYRLFNVLGSRTQVCARVEQGEPLPDAPRGFGWQLERNGGTPAAGR
jgi:hypothetical protein